MEATGGNVTWEGFKTMFLNKYFPSNVKDQKETEFLTLQQGDMTVDEYVSIFESLARFSNNLRTNLMRHGSLRGSNKDLDWRSGTW